MDLAPLSIAPKVVPPPEAQLPNESRKFWSGVTEAINSRQFSKATSLKQDLEERQREKVKERSDEGIEWQPRFFTAATTPLGRPDLTNDGKEVLKDMQVEKWALSENTTTGA